MEIQVIRFSFSVSDIIKKTFWHRKVRRIFADSKKSRTFASLSKTKPSYKEVWKGGRVVDYSGLENRRAYKEVWKGGRVVDYSGLENRRAERHRGFESLPFRKESEKVLQNFLQNLFC